MQAATILESEQTVSPMILALRRSCLAVSPYNYVVASCDTRRTRRDAGVSLPQLPIFFCRHVTVTNAGAPGVQVPR